MKDEYNSQECAVCSAPADGLHYGAISCRSCNAFFRRTVVEKAEYRCKHNNTCVIDADGRCACRACRFTKCVDSGMKISAVQPRRDPTGSQKDRRKRAAANMSMSNSPSDGGNLSFSSENAPGTLIDAIKTDYGFATPRRISSDWNLSPEMKPTRPVKIELEEESLPSTSYLHGNYSRLNTPIDDQQQEFRQLVYAYGEHQRMMQLSFSTFDQFLEEHKHGKKLRVMDPNDVSKLSAVELTGLLYWIEKIQPYTTLPAEDREILLKRYSVRKLSLDHFYSAAKHPQKCTQGDFVMNNYTYVPNDRTGFELPDDDEQQRKAKKDTFMPTFHRFWDNVIHPFVDMKITDAEIVFLQIMMLWGQSNNEFVTAETKKTMRTRRDWAMSRLFEWYHEHRVEELGLRFGKIMLLLGEIEMICDLHCQDFHVAKLFEFCDMSKFWYENLCYAPCNTNVMKVDPNLLDNLKRFTAISVMEVHAGVKATLPKTSYEKPKFRESEHGLRYVELQMVAAGAGDNPPAVTSGPHRQIDETPVKKNEFRSLASKGMIQPPSSTMTLQPQISLTQTLPDFDLNLFNIPSTSTIINNVVHPGFTYNFDQMYNPFEMPKP